MRIIILGAGQVGESVAEALASEANDITLVDPDARALGDLADRLDVRTVVGNGALPSVLRQAGIEDAELLVAVTQSDQTNLVACKIARSVFNVPTRIARLRSADFLGEEQLLDDDHFSVSHAICPEQDVTEHIARLVDFPQALQVLTFADGKVTLVGLTARPDSPWVGHSIRVLRAKLPGDLDARVAAIFRQHRPVAPDGSTLIEAGDEVFILAASEHIRTLMEYLRPNARTCYRIMIAGGGNIGQRVALALEGSHEVKLIEINPERAELIAGRLNSTLVLNGEATDESLLEEENIDEMDMFLALTNDDEDNIMAASLAKRMGCGRVLALINRRAYADMVQGGPIDIGMSPAQVSIGELLAYVRQGDVVQVHSLRRGAAEVLELIAHGDKKTSQVVDRRIDELPNIGTARIAALVRGEQIIVPHHDTVIRSDDHVIVFCTRKTEVRKVEKLFQVGLHFF
jgi:trk system potassium uptake protein